MNKQFLFSVSSLLFLAVFHAKADVRVTTGVDYSSGKYDGDEETTAKETPVMVAYESAPWTFTLYVPYVEVEGFVNADVGSATGVLDNQSGLGDIVVGGSYELFPRGGDVGVDVGVKAKVVTADSGDDLLTTGNADYTLQSNVYTLLGAAIAMVRIGWTLKGDIRVLDTQGVAETYDPDDPLNFGIAYSYPVTINTNLGLAYDWRQRLFDETDDAAEISLLVSNRISSQWRLQGYVLRGLSDASPDWGVGAFASCSW
ncbi:MAG: hypothetical protein HPY82_17625 [Gammaproteobacteria bacterium]|nr:hypothetical protein [Gammaproteobacteria bacterium]